MANLSELLKQREALEAQIAEMQNGARNDAIGQVKALMAEYGLTTEDLAASSRKERKVSTVAAKFRDPATGNTWSGRGLQPKWLRAAVEAGASLDSFRV
ncbi:H-NS histone family protein [Roseateles koreensis]|uniref:H-NS histone family protein n=1 Tax=Roseateles koreensis TaxID=2987526 RepID=A0ABT5KU01_9BURK|nr:H-NS histone family protein [Roseateles koreensis]MDC8786301.1 H-NS histone family protein [Roseateles koreensis]